MSPEIDSADAADVNIPFEPQPADLGGCGKPAVVGCLVLLVIVGVALLLFFVKIRSVLEFGLSQYQTNVVQNLSEEVTADERLRLDAAFESALAAIRENRMRPEALQGLRRFMASPPSLEQPLGPDDVRELTEVLEALESSPAGKPSPGDPGRSLPEGEAVTGSTAALLFAFDASI